MTAVPALPTTTPAGARARHSSTALGSVGRRVPGAGVAAGLGFLIVPLVAAFVYSTAKIAPLSGAVTWLGLDNYVTMFSDPVFYRSLVNTALFIVITVPLSMAIGLALAVLMNSVLPGRKVVRTIIYLPLVISGVAVGLIGTFLFNETIGVLNGLATSLGLPNAVLAVQRRAGVRLARAGHAVDPGRVHHDHLPGRRCRRVPQELYESAAVEGATGWQRFRFITLPLLGPVDVLPADHERHLLLPGLRHRLRAHQRRPRGGARRCSAPTRTRPPSDPPATRATAPRSGS